MKIIIAGANGYVGSTVLKQAIADPKINQIFTLTRRPIPEPFLQDAKVTAILHKDFLVYPPTLIERLQGAEACIWAIGTAKPVPGLPSQTVDVGYTTSFLKALTAGREASNSSTKPPRKFTFIYASGMLSEQNQSATLWLLPETRRSRGAAETALFKFADESGGGVDVHVVKPAWVTSQGWFAPRREGWGWTIRVESLARAMLGMAKGDFKKEEVAGGKRLWENGDCTSY